ncbi:MAG: alcohol dehydrogenase catalytic domain-containing protein, partial [Thermoanaerobaculia bacterium]
MTFTALVAREDAVAFETLSDSDLPAEGVLVDVAFSSLNYKDALAVTRRGKIVRRFPMILGIDLAGTTADGQQVLAVGQGLGESEPGGYTARQRVKADALVPLLAGMTLEQSM